MLIPRSKIEPVIAEAQTLAKRTGRNHFVRSINWDGLYSSIGVSDDPEMELGTLHAIAFADGTTKRLFLEHNNG